MAPVIVGVARVGARGAARGPDRGGHAPRAEPRLADPLYGDSVAAAYASALDRLVEGSGAAVWVHGHTHHCVDYRVGRTRVVSNQRGYPGEAVNGFAPDLVIPATGTSESTAS